ncbi:hypothetical protein H4582DRAFT_1994864, partial [Lactarius indigo]
PVKSTTFVSHRRKTSHRTPHPNHCPTSFICFPHLGAANSLLRARISHPQNNTHESSFQILSVPTTPPTTYYLRLRAHELRAAPFISTRHGHRCSQSTVPRYSRSAPTSTILIMEPHVLSVHVHSLPAYCAPARAGKPSHRDVCHLMHAGAVRTCQ